MGRGPGTCPLGHHFKIRYSEDKYYLSLLLDGQRLTVSVRGLTKAEADALVDTHVRVRGVCYTRYTMKRQLSTPWIAVSSPADVVVEEPSPGEPKEVSLAGLAQFNTQGNYGHRLKVSGVVTLQKLDGNFFIQNGEGGLAVRTDQPMQLAPGDQVSVAGYTAIGPYAPSLEDAVVQLIGKGELPDPVPVRMETLLGAPEVVEGVLVRVEASLINRVEGPLGHTLILQSSNTVFTAHLEALQADDRFKIRQTGQPGRVDWRVRRATARQMDAASEPHARRNHSQPELCAAGVHADSAALVRRHRNIARTAVVDAGTAALDARHHEPRPVRGPRLGGRARPPRASPDPDH